MSSSGISAFVFCISKVSSIARIRIYGYNSFFITEYYSRPSALRILLRAGAIFPGAGAHTAELALESGVQFYPLSASSSILDTVHNIGNRTNVDAPAMLRNTVERRSKEGDKITTCQRCGYYTSCLLYWTSRWIYLFYTDCAPGYIHRLSRRVTLYGLLPRRL